MDRVGVIGVSWRNGGTEALARFTIPVEERGTKLRALAAKVGVEELVYLATCNRVEIAFAGDGDTPMSVYRQRAFEALTGDAPAPGEAERAFRAWAGEGAAEHLFLVASGFESARVGESEIAGQVREAFAAAKALGLAGPRIELVMEEALRVAREVHGSTALAQGRISLAELALEHARRRLRSTKGPVAVIGVSPMTRRSAHELAADGVPVVVVNRTLARAEELAEQIQGDARTLDDFRRDPDPVELVILATASEEPVLDRPALERLAARSPSGQPPLIIDMAIPPDVAPEDAAAVDIERIGMEEIIKEAETHRAERIIEAAEARPIIDEALVKFRTRMAEWALSPILAAIQTRYRETAVEGLDRLFRRELPGLGEEEQGAIQAWAETLARRFAHLPSMGLREVARVHGLPPVETFISKGDQKLLQAVKEAATRSRRRTSLRLSNEYQQETDEGSQ